VFGFISLVVDFLSLRFCGPLPLFTCHTLLAISVCNFVTPPQRPTPLFFFVCIIYLLAMFCSRSFCPPFPQFPVSSVPFYFNLIFYLPPMLLLLLQLHVYDTIIFNMAVKRGGIALSRPSRQNVQKRFRPGNSLSLRLGKMIYEFYKKKVEF